MLKIGVLGGIGPEATVEYYHGLILMLQRKGLINSNIDFPQIIINSIPAPELTDQDEKEGNLDLYIQGIKELNMHNVDFIVMVCNTIHLYIDLLQTYSSSPILNIKQYIKKRVENIHPKKYAVLGSPLTISKGLYDIPNCEKVIIDRSDIDNLTNIINKINSGEEVQGSFKKIQFMIDKYKDLGIDTLILGCTELALLKDSQDITVINSIDELIHMTVQEIEKRNKNN